MSGYAIERGPAPDALQAIVGMHDAYYGSRWGFDAAFTRKNLAELSEFLGRFNPDRDGLWTVRVDGRIEGSVAIHGSSAKTGEAELRWFLVSDAVRGHGAGSELLDRALTFCRDGAFDRVCLWTFAGLDDARRLYDRAGFVLKEQHPGTRWGTEVVEQRLELDLRGEEA
jgi:GNAT superfamily N-acetyltransferase